MWDGRPMEHDKNINRLKEPDVTGNPKATGGAADGNRGTSVGEDGICSYRKHRCVYTRCCHCIHRSAMSEEKLTQRPMSFMSSNKLAGAQKHNYSKSTYETSVECPFLL